MLPLKITTIQTTLFWEDSFANLAHFDTKINSLQEETDVIVMPEMFTTGFTMNPEKNAETQPGVSLEWMLKKAQEKKCVIIGSVSVKEHDKYYNRLYVTKADGTYQYYDKRHLFKMGKEDEHYTAGTKNITVEIKGWKVRPQICYDLRFPVWSRNKNYNPYDVLIYVANWPEVRSYPWKQLLIARAIENQCYVIGVNRIGVDGNSFPHSGDSVVLSAKGETLSKTQAHEDKVETTALSYDALHEFRKLFPVLDDADSYTI
jgi:omega-amidase